MRLLRAFTVVVAVIVLATAAYLVIRDRAETARTTPRFDPPVWAGQNVPGRCATGGFYARDQQAIILTIANHCADAIPGKPLHDPDGRLMGTFGPAAELPDCPAGRFCAPSCMRSTAPRCRAGRLR